MQPATTQDLVNKITMFSSQIIYFVNRWEKGPLAELNDDGDDETVNTLKDLDVTGVIISWPEDAYSDFDENHVFVKSFKRFTDKNINVIIELEPGSSWSWFNKSEARETLFNDFYIWQQPKEASNGGDPTPPNNWVNFIIYLNFVY